MKQIKIINKIKEQVELYQEKTGATKTWVAKELGISRQALNILFNTANPGIELLVKISILIECKIEDLYEIENV